MIERTRTPLRPALPDTGDPSRGRRSSPVGWTALAVAFVALVALLYAASLHAVAGNSDGATVALEGQAMSSGNVLLHHWTLSLDSFWSIDALFYTLAVAVLGVHPALLSLVPAVIAALVVTTGMLLARTGYGGVAAGAAMATVAALLGVPSYALAFYFLQGPLHVGTTLWCLLAFAGLRRGRFGRGWAAAVVFLAAGVLGDFQTAFLGMVPALAAGGVAMLRTRAWRPGLSNVMAPVAAVALAAGVRVLTSAIGTYSVGSANPTATGTRLLSNVGLVGRWGANLLGVGGGGLGYHGVPAPLALVHVVGLAAVVGAVVLAAARTLRGAVGGRGVPADRGETWRLDDLLVAAFLADLVVFVVLTYSTDENFSRYLTAAVVFGSVLTGRAAARLAQRIGPGVPRRGLAAGAVVVAAAFGAGLGVQLAGNEPPRPFAQLGRFLEAHHLEHGIGDYWSASITTVQTGGRVAVRPVIADPAARIKRYGRQSADGWYAGGRFQFLVYDTALPWGGVDAVSAAASFGQAHRTYAVGTYRVLVWRHPLSVPPRPAAP